MERRDRAEGNRERINRDALIKTSRQFRDTYFECPRDRNNISQAYLSCPALDVRNVHLSYSRMFGKVDLSPATLPPKLPNPLPQQDSYICCHPAIMKLSFRINLSYAISRQRIGHYELDSRD
jgi:hypothetical protein